MLRHVQIIGVLAVAGHWQCLRLLDLVTLCAVAPDALAHRCMVRLAFHVHRYDTGARVSNSGGVLVPAVFSPATILVEYLVGHYRAMHETGQGRVGHPDRTLLYYTFKRAILYREFAAWRHERLLVRLAYQQLARRN